MVPPASPHRQSPKGHLVVEFVLALICLVAVSTLAADDETVLKFCGRQWVVKTSEQLRTGPGPNFFGRTNVWVDGEGLHLKITRQEDADGKPRWFCAEVVSKDSLGYGTYRWYLSSPIKADPNVVLGLFNWDNKPESVRYHHRELDVELISTWGQKGSELNAQYCVQPWSRKDNRHRFAIPISNVTATTHSFRWKQDAVYFRSLRGHALNPQQKEDVLGEWTFDKSGVPPAGAENVRMNLWLLNRQSDMTNEWEIVISKFEFEPDPAASPGVPTTPEVTIVTVPPPSLKPGPVGMGRIAGTAAGIKPIECKVVVYAYGDRWYVQPLAADSDTVIGVDGRWTTSTHGGLEYAALLVKAGYSAVPALADVPAVGGDVLAVTRVKPKD